MRTQVSSDKTIALTEWHPQIFVLLVLWSGFLSVYLFINLLFNYSNLEDWNSRWSLNGIHEGNTT